MEENLRKIKIREISDEEKNFLWHRIALGRLEKERQESSSLSSLSALFKFNMNILNFGMKKLIVGVLVVAVLLGGAGVVAASNDSAPGDLLFPVELALEKIQLKFSGESGKEKLRLRFSEERIQEIRKVSEEKRSLPAPLVADLSSAVSLEIEVDVFTDETVVKIEADGKKYGYLSALKTKEELIKEISGKYSIPESKILAEMSFEREDRESHADDKGFLNKTHSINFSDEESEDVSRALTEVENFLNQKDDGEEKEELRKSLAEILILLGDEGKLEISRDEGKIKVETKNGKVKIKMEEEKVKSKESDTEEDDSSDDSRLEDDESDDEEKIGESKENNDEDEDSDEDDSDDDSKSRLGGKDNTDTDVSDDKSESDDSDRREDDSEMFCRGEWRDPEDCEEKEESGKEDGNNDDKEDADDNDNKDSDDASEDDSGDASDDDAEEDDDGDDDENKDNSGKDDESEENDAEQD